LQSGLREKKEKLFYIIRLALTFIQRSGARIDTKIKQTDIGQGRIFSMLFVCLMVFNATFNNISVISWWSVLLLEDLEKTTDPSQVTEFLKIP
jgi:hypothetical protein